MYDPTIDKILAVDTETSGLNYNNRLNRADGYQIVSIGMIVADATTFKEIDRLYLEIQWNGKSEWSKRAEKIHGLTKSYLEENGIPEEEAVEQIALFINEHFGIDKGITLFGHNPSFDHMFLRDLLERYECDFKFNHRMVDTFSLGLTLLGAFDSNQLFDVMGFESRSEHNSMRDIEMTLQTGRLLKKLWRKHVGISYSTGT